MSLDCSVRINRVASLLWTMLSSPILVVECGRIPRSILCYGRVALNGSVVLPSTFPPKAVLRSPRPLGEDIGELVFACYSDAEADFGGGLGVISTLEDSTLSVCCTPSVVMASVVMAFFGRRSPL